MQFLHKLLQTLILKDQVSFKIILHEVKWVAKCLMLILKTNAN